MFGRFADLAENFLSVFLIADMPAFQVDIYDFCQIPVQCQLLFQFGNFAFELTDLSFEHEWILAHFRKPDDVFVVLGFPFPCGIYI